MNKQEAVFRYKTAMAVFKNWQSGGLISKEELSVIDTIMLEKNGLSLSSIYRENPLTNAEKERI